MQEQLASTAAQRKRENRRHRRTSVRLVAALKFDDKTAPMACVVCDMSEGGAKLGIAHTGPLPKQFTLILSPKGVVRRCELRWRTPKFIGVKFVNDEEQQRRR